MKIDSLGFIGSGRAVAFMLEGFSRSDIRSKVILTDRDPNVSAKLAEMVPFACDEGSSVSKAAAADIVFLAVPPPKTATVMKEIAQFFKPSSVVVSLAPNVTLAVLASIYPAVYLARCIPSAPAALGVGYNPICYTASVDRSTRNSVSELLSCLGAVPEVPETTLEAYALLTAMGPTYLWPILSKLAALGTEFGLDKEESRRAVAAMAAGAARLFGDETRSEDSLANMIPSRPLAEEEPGFRDVIRRLLRSFYERIRP